MKWEFSKYQALGNDMIVIDPARCAVTPTPAAIRLICDRHLGAGADGVCFGPSLGLKHPLTMRFFSPDGSEAEKSGNGLRIFARYLRDSQLVRERRFLVSISGETIPVHLLDANAQTISLGMGLLEFGDVGRAMTFAGTAVNVTTAFIGNPHAVIFGADLDLIHRLGPIIESAPVFPNRTNVQMVRVIDRHTIQIEIWERGAGYTISSGTSSSAAAGAAIKLGYCESPVEVRMAGGAARVAIGSGWQVEHAADVALVYQATFSASMQNLLTAAGEQAACGPGDG